MNDIEIKSSRLKYTTYEISEEINLIKKSHRSINDMAKFYSVDVTVLSKILKYPKIFTLEMYEVASKVLEKTIDELTQIEKDIIKPSFRKGSKAKIDVIKEELGFANLIFDEIILNQKIKKNS